MSKKPRLPPLPAQSLLEALRSAAPPEVEVREIVFRGARVVLVGEAHYTKPLKQCLAERIAEAHESGSAVVFVETAQSDERREAGERVRETIDVGEGPPPENAENSLLVRLRGIGTQFPSRPEENGECMLIEPGAVWSLASLQCPDPEDAEAYAQAAVEVGLNVSSEAVYVLRRMVLSDAVDSGLEELVYEQLTSKTKLLAEVARQWLLSEGSEAGCAEFQGALDEVLHSPARVSDAVFATSLARNLPGASVVVAGRAHTEAIADCLRTLQRQPRETAI
jgi:hypothetical protein